MAEKHAGGRPRKYMLDPRNVMEGIRLSVHGSRSLDDERVKIILLEEVAKHKPSAIVTHGEPGGVCKVARDLCRELAIPLALHYLNFKYLRGAFEHRSNAVLNDSDHAVFIYDGSSKGTSNEIGMAKGMGIPSTYYEIDPSEYKDSVGFEPTTAWTGEIETEPLFTNDVDDG